jgi:hypothetical protein
MRRSSAAKAGAVHAVIPLPEKFDAQEEAIPELSPDGQAILFSPDPDLKSQVWLRALSSAQARPISGTEGAEFAFWSPDGRSIGFFADKKMMRVDVGGGTATTICADVDEARGGTWGRDGTIVFRAAATRSFRFRQRRQPRVIDRSDAKRGDTSHRCRTSFRTAGISSISRRRTREIRARSLRRWTARRIDSRGKCSNGAFSAGRLLLAQRSAVCPAVRSRAGRLEGSPALVAEGVQTSFWGRTGRLLVSADGTPVFALFPVPALDALLV